MYSEKDYLKKTQFSEGLKIRCKVGDYIIDDAVLTYSPEKGMWGIAQSKFECTTPNGFKKYGHSFIYRLYNANIGVYRDISVEYIKPLNPTINTIMIHNIIVNNTKQLDYKVLEILDYGVVLEQPKSVTGCALFTFEAMNKLGFTIKI